MRKPPQISSTRCRASAARSSSCRANSSPAARIFTSTCTITPSVSSASSRALDRAEVARRELVDLGKIEQHRHPNERQVGPVRDLQGLPERRARRINRTFEQRQTRIDA